MARMGGERKEGGVMIGPMIEQIAGQADEIGKLRAAVAELVGLLRMGQELKDAAYDEGQYAIYDPPQHKEARVESLRIIALYNAAIAKHGGGQ